MSEFRKYVKLIESVTPSHETVDESNDYLFSYDAERLYETSGISLTVLIESRIDWLRDNIMHKLEPLAEKEGKPVVDLFNWIIDQDPSKKKQYSQWLMKILVGKNAQSSLGDLANAKQVLSKYEELKNSKALKPEHKDLNRFKSIEELSQAISDTESNIKSEHDAIEQRARNESDIIHEDGEWLVVVPKTQYAAGYWGKESLWCTATGFEGGRQEDRTENMFDTYSKRGNLYIFLNKSNNRELYQLSVASEQFMDSEDDYVEYPTTKKILSNVPDVLPVLLDDIKASHKEDIDNIWDIIRISKMIFGYIIEPIELGNEEDYLSTPEDAYNYAINVKKGKFAKGEDVISTSPKYSFDYAYKLGKRFPKGEEAISTNATASFFYAIGILKKRFRMGEDAIATKPNLSLRYAQEVIVGRFTKGEDAIATNSELSLKYAEKIIVGRFTKGEDSIASNANDAYQYSYRILNKRFKKGEDAIAQDPRLSLLYAGNVLEGRFIKGEDAIATDPRYSFKYATLIIQTRFEKGEDAIATDMQYSLDYARDILKGRFEKAEDTIGQDGYTSLSYAKEVINGRFEKGEDAIRGLSTNLKTLYYKISGKQL